MTIELPRGIRARVEALLGRQVVATRTPKGGFTPAIRRVCQTASGSVFVKVGTSAFTVRATNREIALYSALALPCMPRMIAGETDEEAPILILEDLSCCHWPLPWPDGALHRVVEAIHELHATPAPPGLLLPDDIGDYAGWQNIAANPTTFLATGAVSPEWLRRALPTLIAAEQRCTTTGETFLHMDLRSDNLCLDGERVIFVDWNWAVLGSARMELAFFINSVTGEGGPRQETVLQGPCDEAAVIAGFFGDRMGLPVIPVAPLVRQKQREQFDAAIAWAVRSLGLPPMSLSASHQL